MGGDHAGVGPHEGRVPLQTSEGFNGMETAELSFLALRVLKP